MEESIDIQQKLKQFTGTLEFYHHIIDSKEMLLTEGAVFIRNELKVQWIFDLILKSQEFPSLEKEEFQVWDINKVSEGNIKIECSDGNKNNILSVHALDILPIDNLTLWYVDGVCMLPTEY